MSNPTGFGASAGVGGVCLLGVFSGLWSCAGSDAGHGSPAPTVVQTIPTDGATDVDSTLDMIRVTFSEAMQPEDWSWVKEIGSSAPVITGIPFYADELTAILPVRLQPQTRYVVWVNSPDDQQLRKFQSSDGVSAPAYRIEFETR
jgi:hypothetical protein